MNIEITKEEAVGMFRTVAQLADALGCSRQAVYLWPKGQNIPEKWALKIRYQLRPELFDKPKKTA
jgi:predicted transcriptional regulator